ncbi:hypothetical protein GCM10011609_27870 [Lentzea pudingi]|uniref:Nudix hydrolase domain-containing protein n=1 Tax=Lentzea pudingi TaxID=1789439 RepID=A0ABQ2HSF1_9PSEU|nr:NUDIX domain-containing protein [Lentzea pudingi]GGM89418.1 hypothetical protein GCM10011609_27870 [Lentzea pudingi]
MRDLASVEFLTEVDREEAVRGEFNGHASMTMVLDASGRVLLNLRDDKPEILYPNHWAILGGAVEPDESPADAARRELHEEIGLVADHVEHFCSVVDRGGHRHLVWVFVTNTELPVDEFTLTEGQDLRFFSFDELDELQITPFVRQVLNAYRVRHRSLGSV